MTDSWHAIQEEPETRGNHFAQETMFFIWAPDVQEAKSAAAHELQHAIQYLEVFTSGGTVSEFECLLPQGVRKNSARAQYALYEAYCRLAGEGEARNVAARVSYCPELRTVVPWLTQDVPDALQLVSGIKQSDVATESLANVFMSLPVKRDRRSRRG